MNLNGDKGEWQALSGINPSSSAKKETEVFGSLQGIVNFLLSSDSVDSVSASTSRERRQSRFRYRNCPDDPVYGESSGSGTFKLDACIRPNEVTSSHPMQLSLPSSKRSTTEPFEVYVHAADVDALQLTST